MYDVRCTYVLLFNVGNKKAARFILTNASVSWNEYTYEPTQADAEILSLRAGRSKIRENVR